MTRQRLLFASLLTAWVSMVIACSGTGSHETELKQESVQAKTEAARTNDEEVKAEAESKAATEEEVSPTLPEAPRPSIKLIAIKSYPIEEAWRQANTLKGQRVRLTGEAEVKRSIHGVYAVFKKSTGRSIAVVTVKNDDAQPLLGIKIDESETMSVNLETTVKGIKDGWYLALDDSEFLPLDASEGFVAMEELSTKKEPETVEKEKGLRSKSVNSAATNPAHVGSGPSVNTPTTITRPSHVFLGTDSKPVNVRGYYRKDGTYVRPHTRAAPGIGTHHRR